MAESAGPSSPSSPGISPVNLSDCIEELVKFVLQSAVNGTLGSDIGLSTAYCLALLHDPPPPQSHSHLIISSTADVCEGAPRFPLYKYLASALQQWITSGSYPGEELSLSYEDASSKDVLDKWNRLVVSKGTELTIMLNRVNFELHVQEPFFSQLKDGLKTVEGRCAVGNYRRVEPGALLLFNKCMMLEVQDVHHCATFAEMLEVESLEKVLPGVATIQEGVSIYRRFYTEEMEKTNGVLAFSVQRPTYQPYIILADIISGLSYKGFQSLLGLENADETVL